MAAGMALDPAATRAWAQEAKAAFEVTPLHELVKGERRQVGFALDLYARIPAGLASPDEVFAAIWDRLSEIAEDLLALAGAAGRIEIEPFDMANRLRPETQFAPEILLQARLVHGADHLAAPAEDETGRLHALEERLRELGLRARSW